MTHPTASCRKILVVEDLRIVAKDLQSRLKRMGHAVVGAVTTGEEAVREAEREQPEIVLMDIVLAGPMDGVGAARIIRERFGIPVIYLTAHADDETVRRAHATGPAHYLLKPFEDRELQDAIDLAVSTRAADMSFDS